MKIFEHYKMLLALFFSFFFSIVAKADITVHVGPPGLGRGGTNPLSLPPLSPLEYEVVWINSLSQEYTFSISPGFFFGYRHGVWRALYLSGGGGLVINANGLGPGVYSALGYDFCISSFFCFNAEYKQALGISYEAFFLSPYAIRLGLTFKID